MAEFAVVTHPSLPLVDTSPGDWISSRLAELGCVGAMVPIGFAAYARVQSRDWEGPLVQRDDGMLAQEGENGLPHDVLAMLCEIVAQHSEPETCYLGVWEGNGWVQGGGRHMGVCFFPQGEKPSAEELTAMKEWWEAPVPPAFSEDALHGPKLELPIRNYLLFEGPLDSSLAFGREDDLRGFEAHSPDLIWPSDHSWFIATDTDLEFSYIGGTESLVQHVIDHAQLAAVRVSADDPLVEDEATG